MLDNNLATQPFYNEAAVRFWLAVAAVLVALATLANVSAVVRYSRADTELATAAARDEARAIELRRAATELRGSVDAKQIAAAAVDAHEANELIDRRTFSWTELLNRFEATLPDDVRLTSVRPLPGRDREIPLTLTVLARGVDDVNEFMERLEATGAFTGVIATEERVNEDGQLEAVLESRYHAAADRAAAAASPAASATAAEAPEAQAPEAAR